jgi:hypothetical protein
VPRAMLPDHAIRRLLVGAGDWNVLPHYALRHDRPSTRAARRPPCLAYSGSKAKVEDVATWVAAGASNQPAYRRRAPSGKASLDGRAFFGWQRFPIRPGGDQMSRAGIWFPTTLELQYFPGCN